MQDDVNVLREVIRQLKDELNKMKDNHSQTGQGGGSYATGWNARRSLNLLRFSLNRPMRLPHIEDDSDEEMEIVDTDEVMPVICDEKCLASPEQDHESTDVNMDDEAFETVNKDMSNVISLGLLERQTEIYLERNSEPDSDSCGITKDEGDPSFLEKHLSCNKISNKVEEQYPLMQISSDAENTPGKSTSCIEDGLASNASVVPTDSSTNPKSPTPTVSPRPRSSRKSLKTSSSVLASQGFLPSNKAVASIANPSKSVKGNFLSLHKSCFASTEQLTATLHRGLEILESQRLSPAVRRSAYRLSCMPADCKAIIPVFKVDVGIQTIPCDNESIENATDESLCSKCKATIFQQELLNNDSTIENMQLVPVNGSPLPNKCITQVPRVCCWTRLQASRYCSSLCSYQAFVYLSFQAVEKVLAGAIRREMALEDLCSKQNSEIMQLNRLVGYKL